jgi:hypothetical protein
VYIILGDTSVTGILSYMVAAAVFISLCRVISKSLVTYLSQNFVAIVGFQRCRIVLARCALFIQYNYYTWRHYVILLSYPVCHDISLLANCVCKWISWSRDEANARTQGLLSRVEDNSPCLDFEYPSLVMNLCERK